MTKTVILIGMYLGLSAASNAHAFEMCERDPVLLNDLLKDPAVRGRLDKDADWKPYEKLLGSARFTTAPDIGGVAIVFDGRQIKGKEVCMNLLTKRIYTKTGKVITDAVILLPKPGAPTIAKKPAPRAALEAAPEKKIAANVAQ